MLILNIVKHYLDTFIDIKKSYWKIEKDVVFIEKIHVFTEKTVKYIIHWYFAELNGFFIGKINFLIGNSYFEQK